MTFGKRRSPGLRFGSDRRAAPRERLAAEAEIVLKTGPIKCGLVDVSATGARLSVGRTFGLPERFHVRIGQQTFAASLVRSRSGEIGVRFID